MGQLRKRVSKLRLNVFGKTKNHLRKRELSSYKTAMIVLQTGTVVENRNGRLKNGNGLYGKRKWSS